MTAAPAIPFFNYPAMFARDQEGFLGVLRDVLGRGAFILQQDLAEFEASLRDYLGVRHAFGVADGTNALILGLRALGIGPGDEVIVPSHTYIASAAAVHLVGATPVLADIGADRLLDAGSVAARITPRTRAIMPVHVNGRVCDMAALGAVAEAHGLLVVEDAAQALGARFEGRAAGTFGAFGTFSFYPAKVLGCFGDGGLVVTNDDETARRLALLRDHGRDETGRVVAWGTNSRLDNVQAAILAYKFRTYDDEIARRRDIARRYEAELGGLNALRLPPEPDSEPNRFTIYQNYELEAERRDALRAWLAEHGIGTAVQWGGTPVHRMAELGFREILPETERFFERCLMLPMHTALRDDEVRRIAALITAFYRRG